MTNIIRSRLIYTLFLLLTSPLVHAGSVSESTPRDVINRLHETLIESMQQADELGYQGRYNLLLPVIKDSFDFTTIARVVLGSYWIKLDEQQQKQFLDVFSTLSIANYADRFDGYAGEKFEYLVDDAMKKGRVLVKTQLVTNDRVIPFNYVLQPGSDRWRIINVIADGISDLSLKRADYTTIMKKEGFNELVRKLQEKIRLSEPSENDASEQLDKPQ